MDAYTKLGLSGVDVVRNKYVPNDQTVISAQNAELVLDKVLGGRTSLRKRGGLSSQTTFGAAIGGMFEIRFIDEVAPAAGGGGFGYPGTIFTGGSGWHDWDDPFLTPSNQLNISDFSTGTPDDATYIYTDVLGDRSVGYTMDPVDNSQTTGHILRIRARVDSGTWGLRASITDGSSNVIVTKDFVLTGAFQTFETVFTSLEMTAIIAGMTGFQSYIDFTSTGAGAGRIEVSWVQWESPF